MDSKLPKIIDAEGNDVEWWITAWPAVVFGLYGDPFVLLLTLLFVPFAIYIKIVVFLVGMSILINIVFRKNLINTFRLMRLYAYGRRYRIFSSYRAKERFFGRY